MNRATLKLTHMYDNPYETMYHLIRNNSMFREDDWTTFSKRGQLQEYIQLIDDSKKLSTDFAKNWSFDLLDSDTRFDIIANEMQGDRIELKLRKETFYNEKTGKEETREWEATEYDYIKYLLEQRRDYERDKLLKQQNQQRKDNMNDFAKALGFIAAIPAEAVVSLAEYSQDFISLIEGVIDGFDNLLTKKGTFDEGFRGALDTSASGSSDWRFLDNIGFSDAILEWEKNYTFMRDLDGNFTPLGKYIGGVASSLGKAIPMIITNKLAAGTQAAHTLAKTSTALYYTGLGIGAFREMASNPMFASLPTYKLLLNASMKTITEFLIQKGVSKAFGPTQLDSLMWGETMRVSSKVGASSAIYRIIKDFVAEGTEEFLQSYSNWFIDGFFGKMNEEFYANSEWNLRTAIDSFILGGLSTIGGNLISLGRSAISDIRAPGKAADLDTQINTIQEQINALENKAENLYSSKGEELSQAEKNTLRDLQDKSNKLMDKRDRSLPMPKMNFLASWELKNTMSSLFSEYNNIVKNKKLSDIERQQAFGQMYATFRTIADVYKDIGHDRFMAAQKMLTELNAFERSWDRFRQGDEYDYKLSDDSKVKLAEYKSRHTYALAPATSEMSILRANIIVSQLQEMQLDNSTRRLYQRRIERAAMTEIKHTIKRGADAESTIKETNAEKKKKIIKTTENIFESDKNMINIHITKDGLDIVSFDNTLFVPENYLLADDGTMILKSMAEQTLIDTTIASPRISKLLPGIKDMFESITNKKNVDMSEVVYNLYFNESFFRILLFESNQLTLQLLTHLNDIESKVVTGTERDGVYKRSIAAMKKKWGIALSQYMILQQNINYNDLSVLTKAQRDFIIKHRSNREMANDLRSGKTLNTHQMNVLKARVNSLRASAEYKTDIRKGLGYNDNWQKISSTKVSRINSLARLDNAYRNQFLSPFDGRVYLTNDSLVNRVFNDYMISHDLTLQDMVDVKKTSVDTQRDIIAEKGNFSLETLIEYRRQQVEEKSNGTVTFDIEGGKIYPKRRSGFKPFGFVGYNLQRDNIISGENLVQRQHALPLEGRGRLDSMINRNIDPATKGFLTLTDIIREPHLLNKTILSGIEDSYINVNPETAFLYLRNKVIKDTDTTSIIVRADGTYTFANIKPMIDMLIHPTIEISADETSIRNLIKSEFLPEGRLKDITVRVFGNETYYDQMNNIINIARTDVDNASLMRFSLLHEFIHVIQVENNLNGGLNQNWLALSGLTEVRRNALIADVRKHRPDLFRNIKPGTQQEFDTVTRFVYDTSGEMHAMGMEKSSWVDFSPTIVQHLETGTKITMPWGTQYKLDNSAPIINQSQLQSLDTTRQPGNIRKRVTQKLVEQHPVLANFKDKLLAKNIIDFVISADLGQLNDVVLDSIYDGTFNTRKSAEIIRNGSELNDYTFKHLNEYIFKNDFVKTQKQLDELVYYDASSYYAIRELLQKAGDAELLNRQMSHEDFMLLLSQILKNPTLQDRFASLKDNFDRADGKAVDINIGALRLAFLRTFDGSVEQAGAAVKMLRNRAIAGIASESVSQKASVNIDSAFVRNTFFASEKIEDLTFDNTKDILISIHKFESALEGSKDTHREVRLTRKIAETFMKDARLSVDAMTDAQKDSYIIENGLLEALKERVEFYPELYGDAYRYFLKRNKLKDTGKNILSVREMTSIFEKELSELSLEQKAELVLNYRMELLHERRPDISKRAEKEFNRKTIQRIDTMSISDLDQYLIQHRLAEILNAPEIITPDITVEAPKLIRSLRTIQDNIQRLSRRFNTTHMGQKEFDALPAEFKNLFDENRRLKRELYDTRLKLQDVYRKDASGKEVLWEKKSASREDLDVLEQTLKEQVKLVKDGYYKTKRQQRVIERSMKVETMLKAEREKRLSTTEKFKTERKKRIAAERAVPAEKIIVLNQREFVVESDIKMPDKLKHVLNTTFDKFSRAETQFLATADEKNMNMNLKKFLEANDNLLMGLTQAEVNDIVDFYYQDTLSGTTGRDDARKYNAFKIYTLVYLLEQSRLGTWELSTKQTEMIRTRLEADVSSAGTELAVWRSIMRRIDPNKTIRKSLARRNGIVLRDADLDDISEAVNSGDLRKLMDAQDKMLRNALIDNKRTRNIWDRLWAFQRAAMLSGPGTWLRNYASNVLVTAGNKFSAAIGNLFVKKEYREGQYKIVGTKVSSDVENFIQQNFYDNGFLDAVIDGLSKYNYRQNTRNSSEVDIVTEMLASAVSEKVLYDRPISKNEKMNEILNKVPQFIMKMISDDRHIKRTLKGYLGKMLTEDNVDVSKGVTKKVLETLADAFTLASHDYMRKQNFFTKIESELKIRHGSGAYFVYKQILPFAAASMNWFIEGLRYTPMGLAKSIYNFIKLEKTIERLENARDKGKSDISPRLAEYIARRDIGKGIIGTSIGLGIGLLLGFSGVARVEEKDDKLILRIANLSFDIGRVFGTQSILIGMMLTNPTKGNAEKYLISVLDYIAHESLAEDLFNIFRYNKSVGEMALNAPMNSLSMFVPNFLKVFTSMLYTHDIEYSNGFLRRIEKFFVQSIPGIAHVMPKSYDPYTGELQASGVSGWVTNAISRLTPIGVKPVRLSSVEKEALLRGVNKKELSGLYEDIGKLSPSERGKLNKRYGELNAKALKELYTSKNKYTVQLENGRYKELTYSQMSDEQKKRVIERVMSENARYAKIYVYTGRGGKFYAGTNEYKDLRRLGIIKNVYRENRKFKGFV